MCVKTRSKGSNYLQYTGDGNDYAIIMRDYASRLKRNNEVTVQLCCPGQNC